MSETNSSQVILFLANVWPEPSSSAAGWRMELLIHSFLKSKAEVHFACTATNKEFAIDLDQLGVVSHQVEINNSSFDNWIKSLDPKVVVFDRFMCKEQFAWRVMEQCPKAIRVLNTEDLHGLRQSRALAFKQQKSWSPKEMLNHDVFQRELASILRSDLCLIISSFEVELLKAEFNVPEKLVYHLPFYGKVEDHVKGFEEREHFVCIGNFKHQPNWQACLTLKNHIWPKVRKALPNAEVHLYGAYADQKALQLHQPKEGFFVKGKAQSAKEVIGNAKVLLAPLSFGAGLKGKLFEAMKFQTPSVTTEVGAEGMHVDNNWNGFIANDWSEFADRAVQLYQDKITWEEANKKGEKILEELFSNAEIVERLPEILLKLAENLEHHRQRSSMHQLLSYHSFRNNKYMSRWIEEKSKKDLS